MIVISVVVFALPGLMVHGACTVHPPLSSCIKALPAPSTCPSHLQYFLNTPSVARVMGLFGPSAWPHPRDPDRPRRSWTRVWSEKPRSTTASSMLLSTCDADHPSGTFCMASAGLGIGHRGAHGCSATESSSYRHNLLWRIAWR